MNITIVAGTRPNFVKISPLIKAIETKNKLGTVINYRLIHTGQHYDKMMSDAFFCDLEIPTPDLNLGIGKGSQTQQTAEIMIAFEKELTQNPTDFVLVVGDVNSTMACSIVTKKLNISLIHVEGGIRSFDNSMPEEINRKITDSITDYFFITSKYANENLLKEGVSSDRIFFVGNVMIDSLLAMKSKLRAPEIFKSESLKINKYLVLTLHRPSNVDDSVQLINLLNTIEKNCGECKVIFPIHPRTEAILKASNFTKNKIKTIPPLGYLEFNYLVKESFGVITDSGGITEETTVMGIPCITLRENTERPETCSIGTNELVGTNTEKIAYSLNKLLSGKWKKGGVPELWDGKSADRIIEHITKLPLR